MENMRTKMVALLLMMVFASAHGTCFIDCMKGCSGSVIACIAHCIGNCHNPSGSNDTSVPSSVASPVSQRGGPELKEGE